MERRPNPVAARVVTALGLALGLAVLALVWAHQPEPAAPGQDLAADADESGRRDAEGSLLGAGESQAGNTGASSPNGSGTPRDGLPAAITGHVVDGAGRGLPGALVELFPVDPRGLRGAPYPDGPRLAQTSTDGDGAFRLPSTDASWMRVVASAAGRATAAQRIAGTGVAIRLVLAPAATLQVSVANDEGRPVSEALVRIHVEEARFDATTDGAGRVVLTTLPPGTARLRVSAKGQGTVAAGPYVLRSGEQADAIVVLPRGVPVEGVVRDADTGAPIAGVVVHVAHPGRSEEAAPTGPDGHFGPLAGGGVGERIFLATAAEGYAPILVPIVVGAPEALSVELRLTGADPWQGKVVDAAGRPVPGAEVRYSADGVANRDPASTQTDARGRFTLPPPPPPAPGRRVILYAEKGSALGALALRPGSVKPEPLILTLADGGAVHGRVLAADGSPRGGVEVRLTPDWDQVRGRGTPDAATSRILLANESGLAGLAGASAADGNWVIRSVPPGPYQVRYRWDGGSHWSAAVLEVSGPSTAAGTETLGEGARVSGRVTDRAGRAIAGALLRLGPERDSRRAQRTTSGPDGWYEFGGLSAGPHRLRTSLGSLAPQVEQLQIDGTTEQRVDVRFDEGTSLSGRVVGPDGRPYGGVLRISLRREGGSRPDRTPLTTRAHGGNFRLDDLPGGRWLIEARVPGSLRGEAGPVDLDAGRTAPVVIQLERAHSVRGVVTTSAGRPSAGATVSLVHRETGRRYLVTTDVLGAFVLAAVAPGTWQAEFHGPGGAPDKASLTVAANADTRVRLTLLPAGTGEIHVRDERGRAVPQALILFRHVEGGLAQRAPIRTDRSGKALAPDLPVAHLLVSVRTLDGRRGQAEVDITAGDTTPVEIVVREISER